MEKWMWYLILCTRFLLIYGNYNDFKVCFGTYQGIIEPFYEPSDKKLHYNNLRDRYTNCTFVDGNLEITWIQDDAYDLSFLQNIREVTGYVLISHMDIIQLRLPNLQIIRGRTLFQYEYMERDYGLFVAFSYIKFLELTALRDIIHGSVGMVNIYNLCYIQTIDWEEIISDSNAMKILKTPLLDDKCELNVCDSTCEMGCWGSGPENCQKINKINCSAECSQSRCYGSNPKDCCHVFCAGGCTGPTQKECFACKNFNDDGECKQECPAMQIYNQTNDLMEQNPDGKYIYGDTCLKSCPKLLIRDNGTCVQSCPPNKIAQNGECVPCDGCLKTCQINQIVHFRTIDIFKGCNIIEGSIDIWIPYLLAPERKINNGPFLLRSDPLDTFLSVTNITDYLSIRGDNKNLTDLSFLKNLKVIGGQQVDPLYQAALLVMDTSLEYFDLKSLKHIYLGAIVIVNNTNLCFVQNFNWTKIQKSQNPNNNINSNQNSTECKLTNQVCSGECSSDDCWGAGPDKCFECPYFKHTDTCLTSCISSEKKYQVDNKTCADCHSQCKGSCSGPNADDCDECANDKDGEFCVQECHISKYPENGICINCHESCNGCIGPRNTISADGCIDCDHVIINESYLTEECLVKNATCPDVYYNYWVEPNEQGPLKKFVSKSVCLRCNALCTKCSGEGVHESVCIECSGYKSGEQCEDKCDENQYADQETRTCYPCDVECQMCHASGPDNCHSCKNFKIFRDDIKPEQYSNTTLFNCTSVCPPEYKYIGDPKNNNEHPYCSATEQTEHTKAFPYSIVVAFGFLSFLVLLILLLTCIHYRKTKDIKRINQILAGAQDSEPLRPTNVGPNLTKLRIIKEAEIKRDGVLGMGAFGKVYKGFWTPENENVKIPVAIKVLMDMSGSESSKEFLDEAYIMCSVEHPNLLKLHAVCMTSQMMLITQLMPLGCLLDYVRNNKDKIGSKALLNWSTQIARGMSYLEERRLVHRDLAARNVLVQTPSCIKITDFGLSKLLDYDSDTYQSAGGRMPIKWLALESIRYGVFTSHSDVWSFGITIWELLTYGSNPYENIAPKDVADLIEGGHKLPQPDICSLDVYCILLSCWVFDADLRPTFKQLSETFSEKARDHSRYLVVPRDEFLQLPSYTAKDEKKIIRKMTLKQSKRTEKDKKEEQFKINQSDDHSEYIDLEVQNNKDENNNKIANLIIPSSGYINIKEVFIQLPSASVHNPEYMLNCSQSRNK